MLITGAYPGVKVYGTAPVDTAEGKTAATERLDLLGLERAARERKGLVCVCVLRARLFLHQRSMPASAKVSWRFP